MTQPSSGRSRRPPSGRCRTSCTSSSLRHLAEVDLEAELLELRLDDLGRLRAGPALSPTIRIWRCPCTCRWDSRPSSCTSRPAPCRRSGSSGSRSPGPSGRRPPRSPGARREEVRRRSSPSTRRRASGAARCGRSPAMTALRTLMLSNGLIVVFSDDVAVAAAAGPTELVLACVVSGQLEHRRRRAMSPLTRLWPSRICGASRRVGSLPSLTLIVSR